MPPGPQSRRRRLARRVFRALRLGVLLVLLALVGSGVYLNQVGLPDFLKRPLLEKLRARGVDLEFSRLRLRWHRGIVAEDVRFGRADQLPGPKLSIKEVELRLNRAALKQLELQPGGLVLRGGHLAWPVVETNRPARELSVEGIETGLHFLPDDQWELDNFQARFAGATLQLSGSLTNASAVREWKFLQPTQKTPPAMIQQRLRQLADTLERIAFSAPPELRVAVYGDARDVYSFNGALHVSAPGAATPWGTLSNGVFTARVTPPTNEISHAELRLQAEDAQTPWGAAQQLRFTAHLLSIPDTELIQGDLELSASRLETPWAAVTNAEFTAHWTHARTNPIPLEGQGALRAASAGSRWGGANNLQLTAQLSPPTDPATGGAAIGADARWGWWTNLAPFALEMRGQLADLESPRLRAEKLRYTAHWRAPDLVVADVHAQLYNGELNGDAGLNVAACTATFRIASDIDAQEVAPLLSPKGRRWLAQFSWEEPPRVDAQGSLTLPAWTNRQPDWRGEVQPTLRLQGDFQVGRGAYRGIPVASARSHFTYSNMAWHLPDLLVTRPEGQARLEHRADDRTRDYYWRIHSTIDPRALRSLLKTNEQRVLDYFHFTAPPVFEGEVWGHFHAPERTGLQGKVALTNVTFRGESADSVMAALEFTNRFLKIFEPEVLRQNQRVTASGLGVDFHAQKIYLTNGFGAADPMAVARAIGHKTAEALEPYQFMQPPSVRASGVIAVDDPDAMDLRFDVNGGPFHWTRFNLSHVSGTLLWHGQMLTITNAQAGFYEGRLDGSAAFDFRPATGTDFHFHLQAADANLHPLMADLNAATNRLEGILNGLLTVTSANSAYQQSWQGSGRISLRDGLIWEIPIFGIFSPVLNGIWHGLGNSRFSEGSAKFTLTNSVVHTDNLEIRSPMLRMQYRGAVEFDGSVDARVEAELLRDVPLLGPVMSLALMPITKLFEYHVTGTLARPKSEPVYIPKLLLLPLRPIKTLKEMLPEEPVFLDLTNAPPAKAP